jgi:hypothetical protein
LKKWQFVVVMIFVSFVAFSDQPVNPRYISLFEMQEEMWDTWIYVRSENSCSHEVDYEGTGEYILEFFEGGIFIERTMDGTIAGTWEVFEADYQLYVDFHFSDGSLERFKPVFRQCNLLLVRPPENGVIPEWDVVVMERQ